MRESKLRVRLVPTLAVLFFVAMLFFVTYPGYVPFNRIRPFVFGLPFSLFWQVLWIVSSLFVLAVVYRWERRSTQNPTEPRRDDE